MEKVFKRCGFVVEQTEDGDFNVTKKQIGHTCVVEGVSFYDAGEWIYNNSDSPEVGSDTVDYMAKFFDRNFDNHGTYDERGIEEDDF